MALPVSCASRCLVTARKARILRLAGAWDDSFYTTHDAGAGGADGVGHARVRATFLGATRSLKALLATLDEARAAGAPFTSVVGIRPTGWTHQNSVREGQKAARDAARRGRAAEPDESGRGDGEPRQVLGGSDDGDEGSAAGWGAGEEGRGTGEEAGDGGGDGNGVALAEEWRPREPRVWGKAREYSLPYSEHSSYPQLRDFVRTVKPK